MGEDVAVVGIDDSDEATISYPPLTTVTNYSRLMGERAVDILRHRIATPDAPPMQEKLHPYISIRRSCGARR